ncbi:hypothetical protein QRD43_13300 [Pelomonas sp. APW6]|uniref:O-antigen polymerase n=1 Tax=Roseateles subflavus TaxID=3053353 RepID=A0ABT7LJ50_9BURK|nr:hypothetical protein [Pelomonas sp. APW6]MDL5032885.1 hypothetical protein [Pelomonas sp. APW6]
MRGRLFWFGLLPVMLLLALAAQSSAGHGWRLWALTGVSMALLVLMRTTVVSWFYSFMAVFYVLGCWFKVMAHSASDLPYVEPAGNFSGSPAEWGEYYEFAIVIGLALFIGRVLSLMVWDRRKPHERQWEFRAGGVTGGQWGVLVGVAALFYLVNNLAAFFVTGVNARVTLPFALNAPLAFMALIGFAMVLATYVARDVAVRQRMTPTTAFAILMVASIASVSMASRAAVVMQAIPILLAAHYLQSRWGKHQFGKLPVLMLGGFVALVLVAVSIYRVKVFSGVAGADGEMLGFFLLESGLLVVDRWVGAEAIMVAVAEPVRSMDLFWRLMAEDPAIGVDSIYQQLSGGKYELLKGLTFLTLPGYFGVISLCGELFWVFVLVLAMTLLGLAFEALVRRLLCHQMIPVALICGAVANALTQLSFPRLLGPFLLQMLLLAGLLGLLLRGPFGLVERRPAPDAA